MPSKGPEHFDLYLPQTAIKHAILRKYLAAYLTALGRYVDAFHYVDGFAGPGTYGEGHPGSPLQAINLLVAQRRPATVSLTEADPQLFDDLSTALSAKVPLLFPPLLRNAEFADVVSEVCTHPVYRKFNRVGTFAFIDPCGVRGVRMADIRRVMELNYAECLLFWNFAGVRRWIGAIAGKPELNQDLVDFFGGDAELSEALRIFRSSHDAGRKEHDVRELYFGVLRKMANAEFIVPFRFQARDRTGTSHYLIHCSNHSLAFKIMKEVMWGVTGSGIADGAGEFGFLRPDESGAQTNLFRPNVDAARQAVLEELDRGERPVGFFSENWIRRPTDFLVGKQYVEILLDLEAQRSIEVLNPGTHVLKPLGKRLRKGAPTLGPKLIVRRLHEA
jgi:three-Cys-motif partner protein